MKFWHCLAPAAMGAAVGFRKPLYFISTGYGAAIAMQSVVELASGRAAAADPLGQLHLAAMAAYGARLAGFVLWRDSLPSYQPLKAKHDGKLEGWGLAKKLGMWASVAPLYWAMFSPAFLNSAPGAAAAASPLLKAISLYVGAPLMLGALVWEAVADHQQQRHHEAQAGAPVRQPCTTGLWRYSRQANYFGEVAFWAANYVTALRSFNSWPQALGSAIGVASILAIIATESICRAAERDRKYGGQPQYERYKENTPQIVPCAHWIRSKAEVSL